MPPKIPSFYMIMPLPYSANLVKKTLQGFVGETLKNPLYSPNLALRFYHIFGTLKNTFVDNGFIRRSARIWKVSVMFTENLVPSFWVSRTNSINILLLRLHRVSSCWLLKTLNNFKCAIWRNYDGLRQNTLECCRKELSFFMIILAIDLSGKHLKSSMQ